MTAQYSSEKKKLADELCDVMGWDEKTAWEVRYRSLTAYQLRSVLDKIAGLQIRKKIDEGINP